MFEGITPILRVRSLSSSIDYYVQVLGFKLDWQLSGFASVSRDRCGIFLCEGDQGHPGAWAYVGVQDAEALFREYRAKGAKVRHPPTNYPWAFEMQIEDLDGHVLRLGSEPKPEQACGEWLDMRGNCWVPAPNGGWMRTPTSTGEDRSTTVNSEIIPSIVCNHPDDVAEVTALNEFRLRVRFNDGLEGYVEMSTLIHSSHAGVFAQLTNPALFAEVYVQYGAVTWPGELDLAPDAMYAEIKKNGEWILT